MSRFLAFFCLGALISSSVTGLLSFAMPLLLVLGALVVKCLKRYRLLTHRSGIVVSSIRLAIFMAMGVAWVSVHWQQVNEQALPLEQGRVKMQLSGSVARVSDQGYRLVFDFYPQNKIPYQKIKVSCYTCPFTIKSNQTWQLALKLKPIISFHNPDGFDYRKWMLTKGYSAQGFVDIKQNYNALVTDVSWSINSKVDDLLKGRTFPFLRALLLGDKQNIESDVKRFIATSGIGHLFVVSGLHVGVIALFTSVFFSFLLRPLLLSHWRHSVQVSLLLGGIAALFYGYLSGFNVPALRACLMLLLGGVFLLKGQANSVLLYFLGALFLVLMVYPLAFMDMGSWLSFLIVLVLILGFSNRSSKNAFESRFLFVLIKTQWLAFLAGGLVLLSFYQTLAPAGFALNLLLVPIMALLLLPLSFMALMLALLGWPDALVFMEGAFQNLFEYTMQHQSFFTWWPVVHEYSRYLLLVAFCLLLLPRAMKLRALAFGMLIVALILPVNKPSKGAFELTVLDVGQGSAALLRTATKSILVDTGLGFKSGMGLADYVVLPQLRRSGIRTLDLLHLTHSDKDHAGGRLLLEPISRKVTEQDNCPLSYWVWDGVSFDQFQAPGFKEGNNGSCLLKVTSAAGRSVLFSGDIEEEAELALLEAFQQKGFARTINEDVGANRAVNEPVLKVKTPLLSADILIAPHHGSRTSSHIGFMEAVNPETVMISAGQLNSYGHPHEQVLTRYKSKSINIYSSAVHGAMQVMFGARQAPLVVSTYRPKYK